MALYFPSRNPNDFIFNYLKLFRESNVFSIEQDRILNRLLSEMSDSLFKVKNSQGLYLSSCHHSILFNSKGRVWTNVTLIKYFEFLNLSYKDVEKISQNWIVEYLELCSLDSENFNIRYFYG
jgi:hypothetical protein